MKAIGEILAKCRKDMHMTQKEVSEELKSRYGMDVTVSQLSHWEKETSQFTAKQFLALCSVYQITNMNETFGIYEFGNPIALLNEKGKAKVYEYAEFIVQSGRYLKNTKPARPLRKIRKFHLRASAGTGQYLDSDAYDIVEVGEEVSPRADFGITIAGNSMEPEYADGQTVWVHRQETLDNGEVGIFYYNGNAYCKKYAEKDGEVMLVSFNPSYEPMTVGENDDFHIFGKVVG